MEVKIFIGILSLVAMMLTMHFVYQLLKKPEIFLESNPMNLSDMVRRTFKSKLYLGFVYVGIFAWSYLGVEGMLFWIPSELGAFYEGEFHPIKSAIACLLAVISLFGFLGSLEERVRELVAKREQVRYLENRVKKLESQNVSFIRGASYGTDLEELYQYQITHASDIGDRQFYESCLENYKKHI